FVWQMDAANRFTQGIEDFARLLGPKTAAVLLTESWEAAASILKLDPKGDVARALASHHTWSGIVVDWPTDHADRRLAIEMSGLPVFDRDRQFAGFRGFAICRDAGKAAPREPEPAMAPSVQPALSAGERTAFRELARELGERLKTAPDDSADDLGDDVRGSLAQADPVEVREAAAILDKVPVGILIYRARSVLYANRAFLAVTGHRDVDAWAQAGGLDSLFLDQERAANGNDAGGRRLTIRS